jgi:nucleoside-diphosphate-sugar epimerase
MRRLVLGGTVFLSRAITVDAVARGHDVTCAARGESGSVPAGARHVVLDREAPDWSALDGEWDAVVDVARTPSWVADSLDALADRAPHWTFVSSISVYADHSTPGGSPDTLPLLPPITEDVEQDTPEKYGSSKVACEQTVQARAREALVVRPGLIIGPGDPSGRFSYWPDRLAEGGDVLAPESPDRDTQAIDVRDLAAWIVTCAEQRVTGVYDATGEVMRLGDLVDAVVAAVGGETRVVWATADFLLERDVAYWSGPRSLPLWLPEESRGMTSHDVSAALAAGLTTRPIGETAVDTLTWLRSEEDAPRTGLTRAEEQDLLGDWHTIRA